MNFGLRKKRSKISVSNLASTGISTLTVVRDKSKKVEISPPSIPGYGTLVCHATYPKHCAGTGKEVRFQEVEIKRS